MVDYMARSRRAGMPGRIAARHMLGLWTRPARRTPLAPGLVRPPAARETPAVVARRATQARLDAQRQAEPASA